MKNPLKNFPVLFRSTFSIIGSTGAVTLEFCYDHINDDYPIARQGGLPFFKDEETRETEKDLSSKSKNKTL